MVDQISGLSSSMWGIGRQFSTTSLTDDQKSQIEEILSQYDAENLTSDDAKAIFDAFKEAGIQPSDELKETVETAGFDLDQFRPEKPAGPSGMEAAFGSTSGSSVNTEALAQLQSILDQYDLSNLTSDQEQSLISQLNDAGLMNPGYMVDLKS